MIENSNTPNPKANGNIIHSSANNCLQKAEIGPLNAHVPSDQNMNGISPSLSTVSCGKQGSIVSNKSKFEKVVLSNSTNVMFGDKTFYQGPVTINQFMVKKNDQEDLSSSSQNTRSENDSSWDSGASPYRTINLKTSKFTTRRILYIAGLFVFILLIALAAWYFPNWHETDYSTEQGQTAEGNNQTHNSTELQIVTRNEWGAQSPLSPLVALKMPVENVIIAHTAGSSCFDKNACSYQVKNMQHYQMQFRNFTDITYNFLVGGDGLVYEGRGWDKRGAHSGAFNNKSICIAFIGKFTDAEPPRQQVTVAQLLIAEGLRNRMLTSNYKLLAQRQVIATESPGLQLYRLIQKWPHWSDVL